MEDPLAKALSSPEEGADTNSGNTVHLPRKGKGHGITHIIGAGLAGLSAAVRLAERGYRVAVYEAAGQAGGRCRSYYDAGFGAVIDNGNHLLLSGNDAAIGYLKLIGGLDKLQGPPKAEFAFADVANGEKWTLRVNEGRWPAWLFDPSRRVPGTTPLDYSGAAALMWAGRSKTVTEVIKGQGTLYRRLWQPLILAALNTDPEEGSARLAGAIMRKTLAKGGAACRPLVAEGLSAAFIEPGLGYIEARRGGVNFGQRLRALRFASGRVCGLDFGDKNTSVEEGEAVILAVPPWVAKMLVPDLQAPTDFRAILNAHYRVAPPPHFPEILGVINGTVEWIFAFPGRLSITISGADRLIDCPREQLAADLWRDVAAVTGLSASLPPWQIVKEKRATFAASPDQDAKRPDTKTKWRNLFLAGDWTQTGLPATIEGAIRSGERAARLATRG
jgi:squalene-associated FAD-dependent desaturase